MECIEWTYDDFSARAGESDAWGVGADVGATPGLSSHPLEGRRRAAIGAAMADAACDHTAAGPCMGALGCVTVAPAIANVPTTLVVPADLITFAIRPAPQFGDLFRTGPPTPPPNQI